MLLGIFTLVKAVAAAAEGLGVPSPVGGWVGGGGIMAFGKGGHQLPSGYTCCECLSPDIYTLEGNVAPETISLCLPNCRTPMPEPCIYAGRVYHIRKVAESYAELIGQTTVNTAADTYALPQTRPLLNEQ